MLLYDHSFIRPGHIVDEFMSDELRVVFLRVFLTAHNYQIWNSRFLTCPCNKINRVEAVGLYILNYT